MKRVVIIILGIILALPAYSEDSIPQRKVNLEFRAGLNVGGASPVPLPVEIRELKGFNPNINPSLEADVNFRLDRKSRYEIVTGLRLERKSMATDAGVKDYSMEITGSKGEKISGHWTGDVYTEYSSLNLTLPVMFSIMPCRNFKVQMGGYVSYLFNQQFDGYVSNGYLRKGDPTGEKVVFTGDAKGSYDFSSNLHGIQYGIMAGVNWELSKHVVLAGHLSWGLRNLFEYDFNTLTFNMYPIYLNVSVGYKLFSQHKRKSK